MNNYGYEVGEKCNRDGCQGTINEEYKQPCTCFLGMPPCGACVEPRAYCDECGWSEKEEIYEQERKRRDREQKEREFLKTVPNKLKKLFGY